MRKILRIVIALIFIASGFVKAVDVVGFSFKLEEYFSPTVFNMPFFEEFSLPIAIFVVALELILGVMLLLNLHLKKVLAALIALCIFFAFLTFYSAYFNKVTDCGCFGDAIKFTPWQSFIKDIILLFGLFLLWLLYRKNFQENEHHTSFRKTVLVISLVATAFTIGWGTFNEPLIDFRDYAIGTDIHAEQKKIANDPSEFKTFYVLKDKKTGEVKEVNQDDYVSVKEYWEEGTPWEIQSDKTFSKIVKEGYASEISKFKLEDENGNDLTDEILSKPKVILVFSYKPNAVKDSKVLAENVQRKINQLQIPAYEISPSNMRLTQLPHLSMDATAIKTIARSNPSYVVLENSKIVDKGGAEEYFKQ